LDLIIYFIAGPNENELMLYTALNSFVDALNILLRQQLEKRSVLENLDLVLLCLDETIDDGSVGFWLSCHWLTIFQNYRRHRLVRNTIEG
jgi:hypothetical protein